MTPKRRRGQVNATSSMPHVDAPVLGTDYGGSSAGFPRPVNEALRNAEPARELVHILVGAIITDKHPASRGARNANHTVLGEAVEMLTATGLMISRSPARHLRYRAQVI
jgi:hypothetical protein